MKDGLDRQSSRAWGEGERRRAGEEEGEKDGEGESNGGKENRDH